MAGVAAAAPQTEFAPAAPPVLFSKNMENYKILNPEKASSWLFMLAGSVLKREIGMGVGEHTLLFPAGSGRSRSW